MDNRNSNVMFFLSGLILGGAVGYMMYSPKGKELTQKMVDTGNDLAENLSEKAKGAVTKASEKAVDKLEDIEKGIARARAKVEKAT